MNEGGVPWDRVIDGLGDIRKGIEANNATLIDTQNRVIAKLDMLSKFAGGPVAAAAGSQLPGGASSTAGQTQTPPGHVPGSGATQPAGGAPPGMPPTPGGGGGGSGGGGGTGGNQPPASPTGPPAGGTSSTPGGLGGLRSRISKGIADNGGGVKGGLLGATKLARGPVGAIAFGAAREIFDGLKSETERAARYQGMEGPGVTRYGFAGGSAGDLYKGGLGELGEEREYAMTHNQLWSPSGLSGQEASQAFVDVTSMGFNRLAKRKFGSTRKQVLDFMDDNKRNLGMDESESAGVMNEAIRNPTTNLQDLSKALVAVSDAAGKAGVNAMAARTNFLQLFHGLTDAGAGAGATRLAQGQATALAHLGQGFQDIDTSAQFDDGMQYRVAAASGMTPGAYQRLMRTNPGAAQGLVDKLSGGAITNMIGPKEVAAIQALAKKYGGREALLKDPTRIDQVATEWANSFAGDMITLRKAIMSTQNISLTNEQVPVWVVKYVMKITASDIKDDVTGTGGAVVTNAKGQQVYADGGAPVSGNDKDALGRTGSGNTGQEATAAGGKALDSSQKAYYDVMHRKGVAKGRHEPMIEKLLAMKNHASMVVLVHAKGGQMRSMTLTEAIQNYPDEMAAGKFAFLEGKDDKGDSISGKSVEDVTGLKGDNRDISREENKDPGKVGKVFDSKDHRYAAYKKTIDDAATKGQDNGGQTSFVDIAPSAKWLLRLAPKGTGTGDAASTGTSPSPSDGTLGDKRMGVSERPTN